MFNSAQEFRQWWIKNGRPIKPPFKNAIHTTDIAYALCLFRKLNCQVELYICKPNTESPVHRHPGVQSISVYLTGNLCFAGEDGMFKDVSEFQTPTEEGTHRLLGTSIEANDGKPHALRVGPEGGAFLIFERWDNGDPVSVTMNWEGELVGEKHAITKGDYVANS